MLLINLNASQMSRDEPGSGFTQLPMIKLTIVDLPEVNFTKLSSSVYWQSFERLKLKANSLMLNRGFSQKFQNLNFFSYFVDLL